MVELIVLKQLDDFVFNSNRDKNKIILEIVIFYLGMYNSK